MAAGRKKRESRGRHAKGKVAKTRGSKRASGKSAPKKERFRIGHRGHAGTEQSTEDWILAIAERLFAQYGYEGVSTKQLAAEAGLTIGAIYHYFSGKDEVYSAAIKRAFATKAVLPEEIKKSTEHPERKLSRLVAWFAGSILFDKSIGLLLQRELLNPRADAKALLGSGTFKEAFLLFQKLLRELLPNVDLDEALASMLAVVFGFSNLKSINTLAPSVRTIVSTPEEIGNHATTLVLYGLGRCDASTR